MEFLPSMLSIRNIFKGLSDRWRSYLLVGEPRNNIRVFLKQNFNENYLLVSQQCWLGTGVDVIGSVRRGTNS